MHEELQCGLRGEQSVQTAISRLGITFFEGGGRQRAVYFSPPTPLNRRGGRQGEDGEKKETM